MNLAKYDEWKDTDAVKVLIYFLDSVVSESLEKLEAMRDSNDREKRMTFHFMERAYRFMKRHRALGAGSLAYHTMLQEKGIPFESQEARDLNIEVHKKLQEDSHKASQELAEMFGEPELLKGYGMRNTTTTAIAPTKSSSAILGGVSQGIEPIFSNYYIADLAKAKVEMKNKDLQSVLQKYGKDNVDTWQSISKQDGSVQHLHFLTEREKATFKTFYEISPEEIIDQASQRQVYIDQSQSLNLAIGSHYSPKQVNALMYRAWESGVCSLYYQHGVNASKQLANGRNQEECVACSA